MITTKTKRGGAAALLAIAALALFAGIGLVKTSEAIAAPSGVKGLTVTGPAPSGVKYGPTRFGNHKQSCYDRNRWTGKRQLLPCISFDQTAVDGSSWIFLQTRNPFLEGGYGWTCRVPDPRSLPTGYAELQCFQITFPG